MQDLVMAALGGDNTRVGELLAAGADPDIADGNGWTALVGAARCGHDAIVDLLLQAGADVDRADVKDETPLMRAASGGHAAIAGWLLAAGASINRADTRGRTALMRAVDNRRAEMVVLLLAAGADVDRADRRGRTPLMSAALNGDRTAVDLLLDAGAGVHQVDASGWTALICSAAGDVVVVKRLLNANPDSSHVAGDGTTALKRATAHHHADVVELIEADIRLRGELACPKPRTASSAMPRDRADEPQRLLSVLRRSAMSGEVDRRTYLRLAAAIGIGAATALAPADAATPRLHHHQECE